MWEMGNMNYKGKVVSSHKMKAEITRTPTVETENWTD